METADTFFYTSTWQINYSFCKNNISVTATDNEGWHQFSYRSGSNIKLALEKITAKVVDQFTEIYSQAFDKYVIPQENKFNRFRDTYELLIQETPCNNAKSNEFVNVNYFPIWTIIYRETSNLVWLLRASNRDGNIMTIHESALGPEDLIKKMISKILGIQMKSKTAAEEGCKSNLGIAEATTGPFKIVISKDWEKMLS